MPHTVSAVWILAAHDVAVDTTVVTLAENTRRRAKVFALIVLPVAWTQGSGETNNNFGIVKHQNFCFSFLHTTRVSG